MRKRLVTIILPNKLGGVYVFVKNLVEYFFDENYKFEIILTNIIEEDYPKFEISIKNSNMRFFNYSKFSNRYYVYYKLNRMISRETDILIANDFLELETINAMKLKYKVVFILHGDYEYYYNLALKFSGFLDKFICVSQYITNELIKFLPMRKNDIIYLKNIIGNPQIEIIKKQKIANKAVFAGRLTEEKGFFDLELIDLELKKKKIIINWTIIGEKLCKENKYKWLENVNVSWIGTLQNDYIFKEFINNDFFIFPTRAEGLGMVIIEAMKCGCIPLVSKLNAGIPEFVFDDETGYMINIGDINKYCYYIENLINNNIKRDEMSKNAIIISNKLFNPIECCSNYLVFFENLIKEDIKNKNYIVLKLNRLDKKYIPNFMVYFIRKKLI